MSQPNKTTAAEVWEDSDLDAIIADVLSRMDRNEAVDIPRLIATHPAYAQELHRFFSFSQDLSDMMRSDPEPAQARTSIFDQAQRSTTSIDSQTLAMFSNNDGPA